MMDCWESAELEKKAFGKLRMIILEFMDVDSGIGPT